MPDATPSTFHATPADAVSIHQDVKSRHSIAVHWGTYVGHQSESDEASLELREACRLAGVRHDLAKPGGKEGQLGEETLPVTASWFGISNIGQTYMIEPIPCNATK